MSDLAHRLHAFLNAPDWTATRQQVENDPALLSEAALALLAAWQSAASSADDRRILATHAWLLRRCQAVGVETAFAELLASRRHHAHLPLLPPPLAEVIAALENTSPARLRAYLEANPATRDELITLGVLRQKQADTLERIILAFINASTWAEKQRLAEENRMVLFSAGAVVFFEEALRKAQDEPLNRLVLEAHRQLLSRCEAIGIASAFAEAQAALATAKAQGHDLTPPHL
jgi:hypothetical protein